MSSSTLPSKKLTPEEAELARDKKRTSPKKEFNTKQIDRRQPEVLSYGDGSIEVIDRWGKTSEEFGSTFKESGEIPVPRKAFKPKRDNI